MVLLRNCSHCTDSDSDSNPDLDPQSLLYPFLPPANEVCKGYVFTRVCHSVHGGSTWAGTPPDQVHPPETRYTPGTRYTPLGPVHSPGTRYTPRTRYTPLGPGTPPRTRYTPQDQVHPPGAVHAGRYGQPTGGTHPTGMHSCCNGYPDRDRDPSPYPAV